MLTDVATSKLLFGCVDLLTTEKRARIIFVFSCPLSVASIDGTCLKPTSRILALAKFGFAFL